MQRPRYDYQERFRRLRASAFAFSDRPEPSRDDDGHARHGSDLPEGEERNRPRYSYQNPFGRRPASDSNGGPEQAPGDEAHGEQETSGEWTRKQGAGTDEKGSRRAGRNPETPLPPLSDYHYMVLGLSRRDASVERVREAYRRAVLSNHPDKNRGDPYALERFKAIQYCYERILRDVLAREAGHDGIADDGDRGV